MQAQSPRWGVLAVSLILAACSLYAAPQNDIAQQ